MIKILIGRQTDSLQEKVLQAAVENYIRFPKHETFVIVPNHIKFTTEIRTINKLAVSLQHTEQSVKNLQVLSFSRLAWYFLKDAEKGLPTQLDNAAAAMLLAKIIEQNRDQLHLFKNVSTSPGLLKQIYDTILQIREGNLDLTEINEEKLDLETQNKIADLKVIYDSFIAGINDKFSTSNEIQLQLNEYLAGKIDLSKTDFYFSDFSHFTLQECLTIKLLMMKAHSVTLAFKTKVGKIKKQTEPGDYDYVIQKTINQLINYLNGHKLNFEVSETPMVPVPTKRELLNEFWINVIDDISDLDQIQLVRADNRYSEAYFVVRTIYQQVALNNYRYRDFLVLAPNLHEYETYLTPILRQNKIPFFNDLQQEMKYHPLVVLIENIAQLLTRPLATQNILAVMKTQLIIPNWYQTESAYLHDIDELENFVLAHGINNNLWKRDFTDFTAAGVIYLDQDSDEVAKINKLKNYFIKQLTGLLTSIKKEKDTQKAITIFFNFLIQNGVTQVLEKWREKAQEEGDLQQARQSEQIWDLLINLLHDYLLINETEFNLPSFFDVLINGFKEATFAQIPATLDAVNLSETGIVQVSGYKQVFILGATNVNLPQIKTTPGFLSTENLEKLRPAFGEEAYLEDFQQLNNLNQNYQFGDCLALAEDKVYLSYSVAGSDNEKALPSIFYERIKKAGAPEFEQHDLPEGMQDVLTFLTNPQASLGYLTYLGQTQNNDVTALIQMTQQHLPYQTALVTAASQFVNEPTDIGPALAQKLYGSDLNASVSQLETFYENSYEYFLNYGLHLHKRFENELDLIQAGNYCHETFDFLVKELNRQALNLAEIDDKTLNQILQDVRLHITSESKYQQLLNDPFNQFLFKCLDKTTSRVVNNWHRNGKVTPLQAKYSELSFGLGEKVSGLNFPIPDLTNHQVNLRGKIDRIDLAQLPETKETIAQIIDYKSSAKKFDLGLFYEGISLQMISYLDVLKQNRPFFAGKNSLSLLGAFYQTITRQLERLNSKMLYNTNLQIKETNYDSNNRLRYKGIINNDQLAFLKADAELKKQGVSSNLYANVKSSAKDGHLIFYGNSFSDDEIDLLLEYDEVLIKNAARQILAGEIKLNPYKYGKSSNALTYSDYRDIFFFDAMLKENKYHQIGNLKKAELIDKVKAKLEKGE